MKDKDWFFKSLSEIHRSNFVKNSNNDWHPMMDILDGLSSNFDEDEVFCIESLAKLQNLIVKYSKNGDFEKAKNVILECNNLIEQLESDSKKLGSIFVLSSFAYFYSKMGQFDYSFKLLNKMIKFDDSLTDRFPVLHYHKLNHIINFNRINLKLDNLVSSFKFYVDIFDYMSSGVLISKYGKGNKILLDKMKNSQYSLDSVVHYHTNLYMMTVLRNPLYEIKFLHDPYVKRWIFKHKEVDIDNLQCFIDYLIIQLKINDGSIPYKDLLSFFQKYNYYYSDKFRYLLLRKLYSLSNDFEKNIIVSFINNKLNFKSSLVLINSL